MKLVVQIPCFNEEQTLPLVLKDIPKHIPGVDSIEILVIDDGSTDKTVAVARNLGVKHFVRHAGNMGLGRSFHDGLAKALEMGADILVNTDGDNQYPQADIGKLIAPVLRGEADIVIGNRQIDKITHFSAPKKFLQKFGSRVVGLAAGVRIPDAASGFRAYSRQSLFRLSPLSSFSYCMDTTIQAGYKRLAITSVPIKTNAKTRESRLFNSNAEHVIKSGMSITRSYVMYRPYVLFVSLGSLFLVAGLIPFARYSWFFLHHERGSHLQSLVGGSTLLISSLLLYALGVIADLIRINRSLTEDQLELAKRAYFKAQ